jgi:mxaJ protein
MIGRRYLLLFSLICANPWSLVFPASAASLRVCADPDYAPYSNRAGQGFENKIAQAVAKAMGETVEYTWASYRGHGGFPQFLAATLDAKKCDVMMNVPYGSREELTTRPYYTSTYVFVFSKAKNYAITSMDSPVLKQLRIGFEQDTPAEQAIKMRGLIPRAVSFDVGEDNGKSPADMLVALKNGKIDVLVTWQPAIGAFLRSYPGFDIVPVPNRRSLGTPEQYAFPMSMGVRLGDEALKKKLDDVIEKHQTELTAILTASGVRGIL